MTEDVSELIENPTLDRESSGSPSGRDVESDGANSDSGDSLFITQKPVPEAVRPGRPRRPSLSSDSVTPQDLVAEPEEDAAKSTTDEESAKTTKRTKKVYRVPKFRFSFLSENKRKRPMINATKTKTFQVYAMGGYIRSVKELWERRGHGGDLGESVPTVDVDGEQITPISEEEETMGDDEDIKVVEKKHFVISLNGRCSQYWHDGKTRSSETRPSNALNELQYAKETIRKVSKMKPVLTSASGTCDDEESLCRDSSKTRSSEERSNTERNLHKEKKIQLDDDSDATFCDPSPEKHLQVDREAPAAAAEPNRELFHMEDQSRSRDTECPPKNPNLPKTDSNKDTQSSESWIKKKKKNKVDHKSVEEEKEQSQVDVVPPVNITEEETHRLSEDTNEQDAPVSKRKKKKKSTGVFTQEQPSEQVEEGSAETSSVEIVRREKKKRKDVGAELVKTPTAAQPPTDDGNLLKKKKKDLDVTSDVPHTLMEHPQEMEGCSENMETKPKKRRKKKKESASGDNSQTGEDGCKDVNFSNEAVTLETKTDFKVKKKRSISDWSLDTSQTLEEDENIQNPQKKQQNSIRTTCEDTIAPRNYSVSVQKTRTSSTLTADEEEQACQIHEEPHDPLQSAAPHDVNVGISASANIRGSLEESEGGIKKKRRKRSAVQECVERVPEPEETSDAGVQKEKKHKRNDCELMSLRESLSAVEDFQAAEAVKLKGNKKYTQRIRPDDTESETSRCYSSRSNSPMKKKLKKKSKYVHKAETRHDGRLSDVEETRETRVLAASPSSGRPEKREKIKNGDKHLQEVGSLTKTTKIKACETKHVERRTAVTDYSLNSVTSETFNSELETASSIRDEKKKKSKRKLYNLKEDFFYC